MPSYLILKAISALRSTRQAETFSKEGTVSDEDISYLGSLLRTHLLRVFISEQVLYL
jgi:hypothetical protein